MKLSSFLLLAALLAGACGSATPEPFAVWTEPVTGMEFVYVPAASFEMGSPPGVVGRQEDETRHRVTLTQGYWLGRIEVTQGQWTAVMETNPSQFPQCGPRCPVETVNYHDVQEFIGRLEELSPGNRFRLPTEAEWELACRAGTDTPFSVGPTLTDADANFDARYAYGDTPPGDYPEFPSEVGSYPPNPWGFYDLHGNMWEWIEDRYGPYPEGPVTDPTGPAAGPLHVLRGGSWYFDANSARCALRYHHAPVDDGFSIGFRLVREEGSR